MTSACTNPNLYIPRVWAAKFFKSRWREVDETDAVRLPKSAAAPPLSPEPAPRPSVAPPPLRRAPPRPSVASPPRGRRAPPPASAARHRLCAELRAVGEVSRPCRAAPRAAVPRGAGPCWAWQAATRAFFFIFLLINYKLFI